VTQLATSKTYLKELALARQRERNFALFWERIESPTSFHNSLEIVSAKINAITKHEQALLTLAKTHDEYTKETTHDREWHFCTCLGVPCDYRSFLAVEDEYTSGSKKLKAFCSEFKCKLTISRLNKEAPH
jgi:hypothetical protein